MAAKEEMNNYRTTAKIVGVVYLVGFLVGIPGSLLIQSVLGVPDYLATISNNGLMLAIGSLLWLVAVAGDVAHGILMFPILKRYNERIAVGYLAVRIFDGIFIAIMVLFVLLQIPLGFEYLKTASSNIFYLQTLSIVFAQAQLYSYEIAMSSLGVAGFLLCYTMYKTNLVPRWLAIWGILGYIFIFWGMLSAIMGSGLGDISSIPGGLWEVFTGVWLLVKGFNLK